jgi:hypothetical protein
LALGNSDSERNVAPRRQYFSKEQLDQHKVVIIKTDLASAFDSVPRALLAAFLFDNSGAKPLWRY